MDWLIIGGGIHGVHIAARLLGEAGVCPDRLRIVDPGNQLLQRWRDCSSTTGMAHLRSPSVHHLDLDPLSLKHFASKYTGRGRGLFTPPYDRPALSLFNAHCDQVMETYGIASLHLRDRAVTCSVGCDGVEIQLLSGHNIAAQNIVLAIGASEQPEWPDWAPRGNARVRHVFEPGFDGWPSSRETVVVVGGGISSAQVALRLADEGHVVHLVARHRLRQHQFDSDPGWVGPKYMADFHREQDPDRRRAMITKARHRGSMPSDVQIALRQAVGNKRIQCHKRAITAIDTRDDSLRVKGGARCGLVADRMLLATGFASCRPGGSMLDSLITSASLPCARCGYPIVDSTLRWHPRVYVAGPLAELELGPVSRNIVGARRAGERLVAVARTRNSDDIDKGVGDAVPDTH